MSNHIGPEVVVTVSRQTDRNHVSQLPPMAGLVMGGVFSAAGLAIVLISLGWLPSDPASVHAPMWVLGVAGGVFLLPGLLMCYYGLKNGLSDESPADRPKEKTWGGPSWLVAVLMVSAFAAMGIWIGLGDGPREFSGGVTGSEVEGRVVFGAMGVLCTTIALWMWYRGLKETFRPRD